MATTPEVEGRRPDFGEPKPELTPWQETPQPSADVSGFIKPTVNDQPKQVLDDQGQPVLIPVQPIFQTVQELKEAKNAPPQEGRRWLAVFVERLEKMKRILTKVLFPTSAWGKKQEAV